MIAIQTWSMLVEAYRELNHRKLFWITLVISAVIALAFAAVGINERGLTILHWEFEIEGLNSTTIRPDVFYKTLYLQLGVGFWLAWIASILALVSTASIFPEFLSGGAIDLWLSKPISRLRLFLTKYAFGLLFVALQVGTFSLASFFVLGIRGGVWEPAVFLAVPLVVCFFSYLFAFCVLFGVLTRSTIASLLLTLLVWFGLFLVNSTESTLLTFRIVPELRAEMDTRRIEIQQGRPEPNQQRIAELQRSVVESRRAMETLAWWHDLVRKVKLVLPKTDETIELLERSMISLADLPGPPEEAVDDEIQVDRGPPVPQRELQQRIRAERRERSAWVILGSSLLFEAGVLALAALFFCRRDH